MRKIFLLLTSVFVYSFVFCQLPGITWQQSIGAEKDDLPLTSLKTIDNQIVTIGFTNSQTSIYSDNHGETDISIEKRNFQGVLQWRKIIGGSGTDLPVDYYYDTDGSLLILGTTTSNDGNVIGNHGLRDLWVCKLDGSGTILWQKCYGGSNNENAGNIFKVSDGNYIISATSNSNNGDLTSNAGNFDAWIFKIDNSGNIQWQKSFGGSGQEGNTKIKGIESSGGSIYFLTETTSNNGDVSGNNGGSDLWLVKLNTDGLLQWQKCLGGSATEYSTDLRETASGDIYVLGNTNSAFSSFHGYSDFYVCRVSSDASIAWQKCYGGTLDDIPSQIVSTASDNSFVLSGYVNNGGGDVVGYQGSATGSDIWILEISGIGDIQWQKDLGGPGNDQIVGKAMDQQLATGGVIKTNDNGYFIAGFSESPDGKTNFHTAAYSDSSRADLWLIKLTSTGTLDWERCFGGYRGDLPRGFAIELNNNDFIITACTNSNDGDVSTNNGSWDTWLTRLGATNTIKGTVFLDNNFNGSKDLDEPFYSNVTVKTEKGGDVRTRIPYNGLFINEVDTGAYVTSLTLNLPYYNVVPSSVSSGFSSYFNTDSISFALQPISNKQDLSVNIIPVNVPRPGFSSSYRIFYRNAGTTTISSGQILLSKDPRVNLTSASPAISSSTGDTLKWDYNNFAPGDTSSLLVNVQVSTPPTVNINDTLSFKAIITPVSGDETPSNDTAILKQSVVGSYDPNDKTENNGGIISSSFIADGSYLQYTVRFQNTGTAEAYNVTVRDTLGDRVDLSTLEIISVSHAYTFSIENGNQLVWQFDNIMLPASSVDEPGSHGYIVYRIRPKSDVVAGETIHNTASIYFDYNLPVLTNDATTLVQDNFSVLPVQLFSFTGQLNNNTVQLKWKVSDANNFERFEIERSIDGRMYHNIGNVAFNNSIADYTAQDNISALQANHIFYRLKLIDADGKFTHSNVIAFNISVQNHFVVYPNPARTEMYVSITSARNEKLHFKIIDASGRTISDQQKEIQKGSNVFPVNTSKLKAGNYILEFILNGETQTSKFTIMN